MKDKLGAICSGLCIAHCLGSPVILALGVSGIVASIFTTALFHQLLVIPVSVLLLLTLIQSYKEHGASANLVVGLLGIIILIAALVLNEEAEVILTLIGGVFLITYHLLNIRRHHNPKANKLSPEELATYGLN